MTQLIEKKSALENIFYLASYFGKGIYNERLSHQTQRIVAPIK